MNQSAAPEENSPAYVWAVLRDYLTHAFSLFGAPAALAQKLWLSAREHKLCADWLRVCEALLRRLVFIRALALVEAEAKQRDARPATSSGSRFGTRTMQAQPRHAELVARRANAAPFDASRSESWRVSFDLGLRRCAATQATQHSTHWRLQTEAAPRSLSPPEPAPNHQRASTALALRLEALVRGFNDPEPLVRRCARLLRRRAEAMRAFLSPPSKTDRGKPGFRAVALAAELARDALDAHNRDTRSADTS